VTPAPRREMLVVSHTGRADAPAAVRTAAAQLAANGVALRVLVEEAAKLGIPDATVVEAGPAAAEGCELVIVFGGDGTLLRAAEYGRASRTPLLGVNLGHVGFLAEAEPEELTSVVARVLARDYSVEERMTIDVTVTVGDTPVTRGWALNEASVEKGSPERLLELVAEVDGRPLSRWGCDGVIFATPTGSTAYAFSAGGPIVWPEVAALLLVPISAHALFARPMVVSPESVLAVEVVSNNGGAGVMWCDGRRRVELPLGARVQACRGERPVLLARLQTAPFTDRLVRKFDLPVWGWRDRRPDGGDA
jgi:NAD+ kinase